MAMLNHPTRSALRVSAREAMTGDVVACAPGDTIQSALKAMGTHHVRRLPVLDGRGHLQGVLSIDDIVSAAPKRGMPGAAEMIDALRAIVSRPTVADLA
jgi:CBS domain-containing protein